ncbi:MAG: DUF1501 domain-containing protein [Bacteroidota bacterium]
MNRRNFLKTAIPAGAAPFILNGMPLRAMASTTLNTTFSCSDVNERILVLIQLHGGNDGLNTIIPADQYSTYKSARPALALPETGANAFFKLTNRTGLHPEMGAMRELYDDGLVAILQNVGYPEMNRSHFAGRDIWLTGGDTTPAGQNKTSGWMGRFLNDRYPNYPAAYPNAQMEDPIGLEFGSADISLGFHREQGSPAALSMSNNPTDFYNLISSVGGLAPNQFPNSHYGDQLSYIVDMQRSSNTYANRLNDCYNRGRNATGVTYPEEYHTMPRTANHYNELSPQLKTIARLIDGGCRTKVFLVRLGGFDTHNNQANGNNPSSGAHAILLYHLATGIKAFMDDLRAQGHADKVMVASFSEFGRQVAQNANRGTDHGTLAPMFIVGKGVDGGIYGKNPDLSKIQFNYLTGLQYDYRQVYATLLQDWLGASDDSLDQTEFGAWKGNGKMALVNTNYAAPPSCYFATFPVGLTYWDAVVEDNAVVRLNWQTATETNNDFFEIQRSLDGVAFEPVERVPGAGTTESTQTYTTLDINPLEGTSYYRLKQVDFDGAHTYFDIKTVTIENTGEARISVKSYPNPATDRISFNLYASENAQANIRMYSMRGELVKEQALSIMPGLNEAALQVSDLATGIYHIEVTSGVRGEFGYRQLATIKQMVQR